MYIIHYRIVKVQSGDVTLHRVELNMDYMEDYKGFDEEYIYEKKGRKETLSKRFLDRTLEEPIVKEVRTVSKQALPRLEEGTIEPLRRISPKIIGGLFDRVEFLKERINEVMGTVKERERLHKTIIDEIEKDIMEKETMGAKAMDLDEKRSIKLDISVLRKEKRGESILFWKDLTELRSELRELLEQYQTESKIVDIFKEVGGHD